MWNFLHCFCAISGLFNWRPECHWGQMEWKAASHLITLKHVEDSENGFTELYNIFHTLNIGWLFKTRVVKKRRRGLLGGNVAECQHRSVNRTDELLVETESGWKRKEGADAACCHYIHVSGLYSTPMPSPAEGLYGYVNRFTVNLRRAADEQWEYRGLGISLLAFMLYLPFY